MSASAAIGDVLTDREPFGPRDSDRLVDAGLVHSEELFDTSNLVYQQRRQRSPTYIIGRKGAGKTAFLRGRPDSDHDHLAVLTTDAVYSQIAALLERYRRERGVVFVRQTADIWQAVFEHAAAYQMCESIRYSDPRPVQSVYDYVADTGATNCTSIVGWLIARLQERLTDPSVREVGDLLDGLTAGGVPFDAVREALTEVMAARKTQIVVVMDNLEDLHYRLGELRDVLQGLFHAAGVVSSSIRRRQPFQLRLCMPSEIWEQIHELSTNVEKDFGGEQLTIYWTARELLHLAATRYQLFLRTHHRAYFDEAFATSGRDPVDVLRAALPKEVTNGLGGKEDPLAYLLRHTQLLPRHLIELLNRVFTAPVPDSTALAVTEEAMLTGTRDAEELLVKGIIAAHHTAYPFATDVLKRLANRLPVCFPASKLHEVFNQEGIAKATGMSYRECEDMLVRMGIVGLKVGANRRYHVAKFQYTFASNLNPRGGDDDLCFHPLFVRMLLDRSFDDLRAAGELATYPFGCDVDDNDYRASLGYRTERR